MADFCNVCAEQLFGDNVKPEIDVPALIETLENNHYLPVLCEGCAMVAIEKSGNGEVSIVTEEGRHHIFHTYEEWKEGELYKKYM